jgi:hypothetical protein
LELCADESGHQHPEHHSELHFQQIAGIQKEIITILVTDKPQNIHVAETLKSVE